MAEVASSLPKLGKNDVVISEDMVRAVLPTRSFGTHKWEVGGVIVVAGAPNYPGAALLCASGAARAGAGVVAVAAPRSIIGSIVTRLPEAVFLGLPEGDPQTFARRARELVQERSTKSRAIVVGPGIGEDEHADALMSALLGRGSASRTSGIGFASASPAQTDNAATETIVGGDLPAVIDADGLNWLAKQTDWWTNWKPNSVVLTPHVGEMHRLLGIESKDVAADPVGVAKSAAAKWKQIVVLKYGHSVVTDGDRTCIAEDAPVSLATAGAGDVLAGVVGGLLAQGLSPFDAAMTALCVGPRAARRVEQITGTFGLLAGDLPLAIAEELRMLEQAKGADRA